VARRVQRLCCSATRIVELGEQAEDAEHDAE